MYILFIKGMEQYGAYEAKHIFKLKTHTFFKDPSSLEQG